MSNSLHQFTWTERDEGDCGAHGCHGHTTYIVTCICGWTREFTGEYLGKPDEDSLMLNHRLEYLERKLR